MPASVLTVGKWSVIDGDSGEVLAELAARPDTIVQGFSAVEVTDRIRVLIYTP